MFSVHFVMTVVTSAIAGLGVGGLIAGIVAVVLLGPTVVTAIVQPFITRFLACTKCVVVTVFVLSTIAAYWLGHHQAARSHRTKPAGPAKSADGPR